MKRSSMRALVFLLPGLLATSALCSPPAEPNLAPVKEWIARQSEIKTIAADFVQTRSLRTLRSPLTAKGKFWFRAPGDFRWQIGDPPKTIVLSHEQSVYMIQPARKTADRSAANAASAGSFDMMSFPMAASFAEFERRFEISSVQASGTLCRIEGLPRDARARRLLSKIILEVEPGSGQLHAFEAITREGSSLRSEFQNVVVNGKLAPGLFDYDFTGYRVTDAKP
ncbi:MAG TPA: outer membrane lipoprotein carrier protein LolA [Chthoniobacterales bacterium]|nr:outer membrane lipoprotein carrier protein LolA [Chthoniobacterales bacterium]